MPLPSRMDIEPKKTLMATEIIKVYCRPEGHLENVPAWSEDGLIKPYLVLYVNEMQR
jgi:hypothetical protein